MNAMANRSAWTAAIAGCIAVPILTGAVDAQAEGSESQLTVRLSESFAREEHKTSIERMNGSLTETWTADTGQIRLDFQLPLPRPDEVNGQTALTVKSGHFEFRTTFDSDPSFRPGAHRAVLRMTHPGASGKTLITIAKARVEFADGMLKGHIEGSIQKVGSVAGSDLASEASGKQQCEVEVSVACGAVSARVRVPVQGAVTHTEKQKDDTTTSVAKVVLRGATPAPPAS